MTFLLFATDRDGVSQWCALTASNLLAHVHDMNQNSSFVMTAQTLREKFKEAVATSILEAAEQVASEDGLAGASLQAIAQRAGVAVGTIYNYFGDRQELVEALLERRREELLAALDREAKARAGASFDAQLDGFVRTVFAHFDARRAYLRIALESESRKPKLERGNDGHSRPAMQQLHQRAERVVRLGVREKRLGGEGADLVVLMLVSIVRGVLIARCEATTPLVTETERVISLFLHGAAR